MAHGAWWSRKNTYETMDSFVFNSIFSGPPFYNGNNCTKDPSTQNVNFSEILKAMSEKILGIFKDGWSEPLFSHSVHWISETFMVPKTVVNTWDVLLKIYIIHFFLVSPIQSYT